MRALLPLTFSLFACQPTSSAELQTALEARCIEFATAMEVADFEALIAMARADAVPFFEAQQEIWTLTHKNALDSNPEVSVGPAERDGRHGKCLFTETSRGETTDTVFHFVLEEREWRVLAIAGAIDDEPTMLADVVPNVLEEVKVREEWRTPHPHMAPLIEAYLEAAAAQDLDGMLAGMTALAAMTPEVRQGSEPPTLWTQSFASGELTLVDWEYSGKVVDDDDQDDQGGDQWITVLLRKSDGETYWDRMYFGAASLHGVWVITSLR